MRYPWPLIFIGGGSAPRGHGSHRAQQPRQFSHSGTSDCGKNRLFGIQAAGKKVQRDIQSILAPDGGIESEVIE